MNIHTKHPAVRSQIEDCSVKTQHTDHVIRLTSSSVRRGFLPSPVREITIPETMNAVESTPNSSPQTSTETSESP